MKLFVNAIVLFYYLSNISTLFHDFILIEKVPAPIVESNKDETQTTSKDQNEPAFIDEKANLMKDLDTKIVVQVNCHQYFNDTYI